MSARKRRHNAAGSLSHSSLIIHHSSFSFASRWVCWSTGKDSAWALHVARQQGEVEVVGLLTTVTEPFRRVSMHGVREELLEAQAEAAGLPLYRVPIPASCPNEVYEDAMRKALEAAKQGGSRG